MRGNEALLLGMTVALSEKDFDLGADVAVDPRWLAGEPLEANGRIGVLSISETQIFNLTETSTVTVGVGANSGGFESSHAATVDVLSPVVEVDMPTLSLFGDSPSAELHTTVAIDGSDVFALDALSEDVL